MRVATTDVARETTFAVPRRLLARRPQMRRSRGTRCTVHCHVCRGTSRRVESRRVAARAMTTVPRAYEIAFSFSLSLSFFLPLFSLCFWPDFSAVARRKSKLFRTRVHVTNARDRPRDSKAAGCQDFSGPCKVARVCLIYKFRAWPKTRAALLNVTCTRRQCELSKCARVSFHVSLRRSSDRKPLFRGRRVRGRDTGKSFVTSSLCDSYIERARMHRIDGSTSRPANRTN